MGVKRYELSEVRWRNVDLQCGNLSIVESAEQTKTGVRYKPPKSGKGRKAALSASVVEELHSRRIKQAEELLRPGIRQDDDAFVYTREEGEAIQPRSLIHAWMKAIAASPLPRIRFHDLRHAHATHLLSSGVHPKVAGERPGALASASRSTYIRMCCPECRKMQLPALTKRSGWL